MYDSVTKYKKRMGGVCMKEKHTAISVLAGTIRRLLERGELRTNKIEEIRLRIGQPVWMLYAGTGGYLLEDGTFGKKRKNAHIVTALELKETMEYVSNYSMYAYESQLRQGYITIRGGHRVGIAGKVVLENGRVKTIKEIGMINIRFAREYIGCSKKIMPYVTECGNLLSTLIISPPGGGKTTLLRDMIREMASEKEGKTVGVVDERSEIAACYLGVPQNDLGVTTDVLDGCPKAEGMLMLLRSMAPDVIAVDEIGTKEDMQAICQVANCGCKILATIHGTSIEEIRDKPFLKEIIGLNIFQSFLVLDNRFHVGSIKGVYKERGTVRV